MKLWPCLLRFIQDSNSITTSPLLQSIDMDFIEALEAEAEALPETYCDRVARELYRLASVCGVDSIQEQRQLYAKYSEACMFWQIRRQVHIERVPKAETPTPDFSIAFRKRRFHAECKALFMLDGNAGYQRTLDKGLDNKIDLERQVCTGKTIAWAEQVIQPHYREGKAYDASSTKHIIENIISKLEQNIKAGQYRQGETILLVDLTQLPIVGRVLDNLLPVYFDEQMKSSISGQLWQVAFGHIGNQLLRPIEFEGQPNVDGCLEKEGILVGHPEISAVCFRFDIWHQKESRLAGLVRGKSSPELCDLIDRICDASNDDENNHGYLLSAPSGLDRRW